MARGDGLVVVACDWRGRDLGGLEHTRSESRRARTASTMETIEAGMTSRRNEGQKVAI
jgi:hypothetical protein